MFSGILMSVWQSSCLVLTSDILPMPFLLQFLTALSFLGLSSSFMIAECIPWSDKSTRFFHCPSQWVTEEWISHWPKKMATPSCTRFHTSVTQKKNWTPWSWTHSRLLDTADLTYLVYFMICVTEECNGNSMHMTEWSFSTFSRSSKHIQVTQTMK